jgi:hypothetical protein
LTVVLDYAREELGAVIAAPVIYRPALAYLDPATLARSRILVLDDAKRTGNNFDLHRRRLGEFGATDVHAAICVCLDPESKTDPAASYLVVDDESDYEEYIREMTELVVSSGLPPEVDHLVFELDLPQTPTFAWPRLEAALAPHGDLSVDAPRGDWGELRPLTLHDPSLPGTTRFPESGEVRNDGPRKVRIFPDHAGDHCYLVPISFPALDLPADARENMSLEVAQQRVEGWTNAPNSIASMLLAEASKRDPETLFRALSVFAELDLICGVARVLAAAYPGEPVNLRVQPALLEHLFGSTVGAHIATEIRSQIGAALAEPKVSPAPLIRPDVGLFLDEKVVETCGRIVGDLRRMYQRKARALGHEPRERVGRSLAGISTALGAKRLLVSRCIDFGLALTTLVPYVDVETHADGSCRVERRYRVSELGARPAADREIDNQRISEEVLAYSALHLQKRVKRYSEAPLPAPTVAAVVAIMRPMLARHNVHVETRSDHKGLHVEVTRGAHRIPLLASGSAAFSLDKGEPPGIAPSEPFLRLNHQDQTMIDRRGLTIQIEGFLEAMRPLFDAPASDTALQDMLEGAAMSSDGALGLSAVQAPIESALDAIETRLIAIQTRPERGLTGGEKQVSMALGVAARSLALLQADWSAPARNQFEDATKIEKRLLRSMGVPEDDLGPVYELPVALVEASRSLDLLSRCLEDVSVRLASDGEDPGEIPGQIFDATMRLRQSLSSLRDPISPSPPDREPRSLIYLAADTLLDLLSELRAFAAAIVGSYRGPRKGESLLHPDEPDRFRTVLFPDLAGSKAHARSHSFDQNFDWKSDGLALFAQWGRAFGGIETRKRAGDCEWHEFQERGDSPVLCAAAIRVHVLALEAAADPRRQWPVHLAIHFGRIKDDGDSAIGLTLDEMNVLCRLGEEGGGGELVSLTQDVLDSCSRELCESGTAERLDAVAGRLPPQIDALWRVKAVALAKRHAAHISAIAGEVRASLNAPEPHKDEDLQRIWLDDERGSAMAGPGAEG